MVFSPRMRFTGTSGLDVERMVGDIMRSESIRLNRLQQNRQRLVWQKQAYQGVAGTLRTFQRNFLDITRPGNLRSAANFNSFSSRTEGGSSGSVSVTATSRAQTGSFRVDVFSTASADRITSNRVQSGMISRSALDFRTIRPGESLIFSLNGDDANARTLTFTAADVNRIRAADNQHQQWIARNEVWQDNYGRYFVEWQRSGASADLQRWQNDPTRSAADQAGVDSFVEWMNEKHAIIRAWDEWDLHNSDPSILADRETAWDASFTTWVNSNATRLNNAGITDLTQPNTAILTAWNNLSAANRAGFPSPPPARPVAPTQPAAGGTPDWVVEWRNAFDSWEVPTGTPPDGLPVIVSGPVSANWDAMTASQRQVALNFAPDLWDVLQSDPGFPQPPAGATPPPAGMRMPPIPLAPPRHCGNDETLALINERLLGMFGTQQTLLFDEAGEMVMGEDGRPVLVDVPVVSASFTPDNPPLSLGGRLIITPAVGNVLEIGAGSAEEAGAGSLLSRLGFEERDSSSIDLSRSLAGMFGFDMIGTGQGFLMLNGRPIYWEASMSVQQFLDNINGANAGVSIEFDTRTERFIMSANQTGTANRINIDPDNPEHFLDWRILQAMGLVNRVAATDALAHVDGQLITSSTNQIEHNGVLLTVEAETTEPVTVVTSVSIEDTRERILNFVESYNELMQELFDLSRTPRPRGTGGSFFDPLTPDEKAALSDREIERWEEQARTGLLHRSEAIESIMQLMREFMTEAVVLEDGTRFSLSDIGLSTTGRIGEFGILHVDYNVLDRMLESRGHDIAQLFTKRSSLVNVDGDIDRAFLRDSGLSDRLNAIVNSANNATIGRITMLAGTTSDGLFARGRSHFANRINDIDGRIDNMQRILARRENALFAMFSRMEQAINQNNSQMEFLAMQMMGMGM